MDDEATVETEAGTVQIVGMDFTWRDRGAHMQKVCAEHPRKPGATRVVLLHDPGAFRHLPEGEGDLVLSGHTHGGQVRIFGFSPVVPSRFGSRYIYGHKIEDGRNLIVSGGLGCSTLPLRFGSPPEIVMIELGSGGEA